MIFMIAVSSDIEADRSALFTYSSALLSQAFLSCTMAVVFLYMLGIATLFVGLRHAESPILCANIHVVSTICGMGIGIQGCFYYSLAG